MKKLNEQIQEEIQRTRDKITKLEVEAKRSVEASLINRDAFTESSIDMLISSLSTSRERMMLLRKELDILERMSLYTSTSN